MAYDVGDEVRIWSVYGYPVGTVMKLIEATETAKLKYVVDYIYTYKDGTKKSFSEEFESSDLALHEKSFKTWGNRCTCGLFISPSGGKHSPYCKLAGQTFIGTTHEKRRTADEDDSGF